MVDFSKGYQPIHFGHKGGVWGKDLEEGKIYRGRVAVASRFRKKDGSVQYKKAWEGESEWRKCNPHEHSIFFPVDEGD